jgi:hypothetical protein
MVRFAVSEGLRGYEPSLTALLMLRQVGMRMS